MNKYIKFIYQLIIYYVFAIICGWICMSLIGYWIMFSLMALALIYGIYNDYIYPILKKF